MCICVGVWWLVYICKGHPSRWILSHFLVVDQMFAKQKWTSHFFPFSQSKALMVAKGWLNKMLCIADTFSLASELVTKKKGGNQLPLRQLTVGTNKLAGRLGDVCCWRRKQWPMIRSHCTSLTPSIKKFTLKVTYIVWPDYPQLLTPILYQCGQRVKTKN